MFPFLFIMNMKVTLPITAKARSPSKGRLMYIMLYVSSKADEGKVFGHCRVTCFPSITCRVKVFVSALYESSALVTVVGGPQSVVKVMVPKRSVSVVNVRLLSVKNLLKVMLTESKLKAWTYPDLTNVTVVPVLVALSKVAVIPSAKLNVLSSS